MENQIKIKTKKIFPDIEHIEVSGEINRDKKTKCNHCSKVLSEMSMKAHIMMEHKNISKCDKCNAEFTDPKKLAIHLKSHDKRLRFVCDICGASTTRLHNLITHKRKHTGERPYKCSVCDNAFAHSSTLKVNNN